MNAGAVLRVARPTDHLTTIAEMYATGLDFTVLAQFEDHDGFDGIGSVLDVEMTMLDKQSKGVPIDEQANDDVVHLYRLREADRLPDQAFDPCA